MGAERVVALFDETLRPIPKRDVDYKSLPQAPTPEEYFLLSRIDGHVTIASLCAISGLGQEATMTALERLSRAGLIQIPGFFGEEQLKAPASPAPPSPTIEQADITPNARPEHKGAREEPALAGAPRHEPPDEAVYAGWPILRSAFEYPEEVMSQAPHLSEPMRRDLYYRSELSERVDCYLFLGVDRQAERKTIRDAYFALSKRYHPDLFFGQPMGGFERRVEVIFQRLNKANRTLSHKKKRAAYDAELGLKARSSPAVAPAAAVLIDAADAAPTQADSAASFAEPSNLTPRSVSQPPPPHQEVDPRQREVAFGALIKRAEKHESSGELAEAAHAYRQAYSVKPDASVALRGANLLMRCGEGRLDEAVEMAQLAASSSPQSGKPLLLIGDVYEEKGEYALARQYYEAAQRLEPQSAIIVRRLKYLDAASR